MYANQVPLHGAYGVEAGARLYFQKSARDLTLSEAATIAAMIQAPARLSPFVNPTRNMARRNNYVLPRMVEEGFITQAQAEEAMKRPVTGGARRPSARRRLLSSKHVGRSSKILRRGGHLRSGSRWRRPLTRSGAPTEIASTRTAPYRQRRLRYRARRGTSRRRHGALAVPPEALRPGDIVPAVVPGLRRRAANTTLVRVGTREVELPRAGYAGAGETAQDLSSPATRGSGLRQWKTGVPCSSHSSSAPHRGCRVAWTTEPGRYGCSSAARASPAASINRATQAGRQVGRCSSRSSTRRRSIRVLTAASIFVDEPVSYVAGPNRPLSA